MKRAREKQAEALALAKANKGKPAMKKNLPNEGKGWQEEGCNWQEAKEVRR